MSEDFKRDIKLINNINIDKLAQFKNAIKKLKNNICRGEISVIDKDNNVLFQTHYEYFTININEELILITRYNMGNDALTLDYTNIKANQITEYSISKNSFTLTGNLNRSMKINILAVYKEKK